MENLNYDENASILVKSCRFLIYKYVSFCFLSPGKLSRVCLYFNCYFFCEKVS